MLNTDPHQQPKLLVLLSSFVRVLSVSLSVPTLSLPLVVVVALLIPRRLFLRDCLRQFEDSVTLRVIVFLLLNSVQQGVRVKMRRAMSQGRVAVVTLVLLFLAAVASAEGQSLCTCPTMTQYLTHTEMTSRKKLVQLVTATPRLRV